MRQPFKDKFLSDVDGDGCPIPYTAPLALINIGRWQDDRTVQTMLADHKCLNCPPSEQCSRSGYCEQRNPEGWREVDGVKLPPITWVDEAREMVREADAQMDRPTDFDYQLQAKKALADAFLHGVIRVSDSAAPDAFIGRKS